MFSSPRTKHEPSFRAAATPAPLVPCNWCECGAMQPSQAGAVCPGLGSTLTAPPPPPPRSPPVGGCPCSLRGEVCLQLQLKLGLKSHFPLDQAHCNIWISL